MKEGIHAPVPELSLSANPIFKTGSIAHVETFQKIPTIEVGSLLKPGKYSVMYLFLMRSPPLRYAWGGANQLPCSLQCIQVQVKVGAGVEAERVVLDEK